MTRKLFSLALCLVLCLGGLPVLAESQAFTVTDMTGREITFTEPVTRIVVLTAADCEILCAIGAGGALVGRGPYCDYPEAVLDVPVVQSGSQTNLEEIIALQPQVVLMATMSQTVEQVAALEGAGIRVVESAAYDIEGVYTAITMIGAMMGKDAEAAALTDQRPATFAGIADKAQDAGKTVYFEVSPLQWGLWTAGKGTFMDELATLCGLTNAFADVEGWAQISEEQVLERNPDFIVTISMYYGEGPTPIEEIKGRVGWESLTALVDDQILNADSDEISRPGPRLINAAQILFDFINQIVQEAPAA